MSREATGPKRGDMERKKARCGCVLSCPLHKAAPDLLAALKNALKIARPWMDGGIAYGDWEGAFVAIDAAVAKAEPPRG